MYEKERTFKSKYEPRGMNTWTEESELFLLLCNVEGYGEKLLQILLVTPESLLIVLSVTRNFLTAFESLFSDSVNTISYEWGNGF